MSKRVAILQSNYIPWKGYFDLINMVDLFVLYDDMQYTRRDWRNRNKIQTQQGLKWLTIPVDVKGKYLQKINETRVSNKDWARNHWDIICHNYSKGKCFDRYKTQFQLLYEKASKYEFLSEINYLFISEICNLLEIETSLIPSGEFKLRDGKSEKLLGICEDLEASEYLTGPSAKDYLCESIFTDAGINVSWMDYSGYPEYNQLYPPFEHGVTILDLLFNEGENAYKFMKINM